MTKNKQRNELSIFEDFRIKPQKKKFESTYWPARTEPKEEDLQELNILCELDEDQKPNSYWQSNKFKRLVQVDEFGELIFSGDERYKKITPNINNLKKLNTSLKVYRDKNMPEYKSLWTKDENNKLQQVNPEDDLGVHFSIKSWLRNQAIDIVSLEIRTMKKKAYEYSHDELKKMIEIEEDKLIKKKSWKALRVAAFSTLGLGWLPFI